jgi:hypothetical protein
MGLMAVFFWLLWGDFCFSLMEAVMVGFYGAPALLPLTLKGAGASNFWIGLSVGTIPAILSATICPAVCFWSDRHRGPRGRRIPFLLWPSFFIALFLVLTAYSTDIGTWLHNLAAARFDDTSFPGGVRLLDLRPAGIWKEHAVFPTFARRALTLEEVHKLLFVVPEYKKILYEVALCSGLRANEL